MTDNLPLPARLMHPFPESRFLAGGIAPSTWSRLVAEGKIRVVRIGKRGFVRHENLVAFIDSLSAGE